MQFIDECSIFVRGGDGGDGCAAFLREPGRPRGGPAGGDGGNGGSVILVADPQRSTLLDLTYRREYRAERGQAGQGRDRYGRGGKDLIVEVPAGVVIKDSDGTVLCDLAEAGQTFIAAQGGHGGRGNIPFALTLELKLLADVGLLGYPNVGKSSLIARVSRVRPKIANYPFTTLTPNLGVVSLPLGSRVSDRSFVLADLPGLIEGAHEGHGLGHRFLRHLQRTRVLIHLLEVSQEPGREPLRDFDTLNEELRRFDPELAERPQLVVLAKLDLTEARDGLPTLRAQFADRGRGRADG